MNNQKSYEVERKAEKKANHSGYSDSLPRATQSTGKPRTAKEGGSVEPSRRDSLVHRPRARDNSR